MFFGTQKKFFKMMKTCSIDPSLLSSLSSLLLLSGTTAFFLMCLYFAFFFFNSHSSNRFWGKCLSSSFTLILHIESSSIAATQKQRESFWVVF